MIFNNDVEIFMAAHDHAAKLGYSDISADLFAEYHVSRSLFSDTDPGSFQSMSRSMDGWEERQASLK